MNAVFRLFRKILDIRKGEWGSVFLMFLYFFMIIASYYILKPVRNSLFLEQLGAHNLPWVYIGTAVVIGFIILIYSKLSQLVSRNILVPGTIIFFVFNLLLFWWAYKQDFVWFSAIFYIWVSIYSVLLISQFWIAANIIYSSSQAKRLFGIIGSGGILGGIAGGAITKGLATTIGTDNLILVSAAVLGIVATIASIVHIKFSGEYSDERIISAADLFEVDNKKTVYQSILESRHLQLIGIIVSLGMVVSSLVDYEFNTIIENSYSSTDSRTEFFGSFFASMNMVSLIIQLFLTSFILRKFGIGISLMILPIILLLGSASLLFQPVLLSAIFIKLSSGSIKFSLDNSVREIVYMPIPMQVKLKVKPFLDMFTQRFTRGIAGLLIIVGTKFFDLSIRHFAVMSLIIILFWIFATLKIKKKYIDSIRNLLRNKNVAAENAALHTVDALTCKAISESLSSPDEETVLYALKMLESSSDKSMVPKLKPLLSNSNSDIQHRTINLLTQIGDSTLLPEVEKLIKAENYGVVSDAILYVCMFSDGDEEAVLQAFLDSSDIRIKCAAVVCMANHAAKEDLYKVQKFIDSLLSETGTDKILIRTELARSFAVIKTPSPIHDNLIDLLLDDEVVVRKAAIEASGKILNQNLIPNLIENLTDKKTLASARLVLVKYGTDVIEMLAEKLQNDFEDIELRGSVARVLGRIPNKRAVDVLLNNLKHDSPLLRYNVIKSLNKLHNRFDYLNIDSNVLHQAILGEIHYYYILLRIISDHEKKEQKDIKTDLLFHTLRTRLNFSFERIFRLLGLSNDSSDIYRAYYAIVQGDKTMKANAYELLDNILDIELKEIILDLIDNISDSQKIENGKKYFNIIRKPFTEDVRDLYSQPDTWLKMAVLYTIGSRKLNDLRSITENGLKSDNPLVRETAEYSLELLKMA